VPALVPGVLGVPAPEGVRVLQGHLVVSGCWWCLDPEHLEDDLRIKRALKVAPNIEFYRYEVKFDLIKS